MEQFMGEKIFYVSNDYAENLFKNYNSRRRENAIEDLKKTIRILKFYSNNDFSFKDVHNEELFLQNGKILVEVVQLFENYKIVYPSKHQFLGDLFEQLLNKGFKQSEGQFFTPTPITRFIWDSLPLNKKIPKVIDYSCGSGHFLTEGVENINKRLNIKDNSWVKKYIFGIEKDYRLARVSKISLFMNGAGEGNIIFGDGLENQPEKQIENNSFDILVANPPYSVKAFKSHLKLKNNSFELFNKITNDGSEIETLFVERIAQLLKPKGIAAVILPSSILTNGSNSYIGAREILLKNFMLRSIVQFGSKTFSATGVNTIALFLEKYNEPPKEWKLKQDSANAIIKSESTIDWEDNDILTEYLKKIGVNNEDYQKFTNESASLDDFANCEYLKMYVNEFQSSSKIIALKQSKDFKKTSADKQAERLKQEFYKYAKPIENEKLLYFALIYKQIVLVVTSPTDNNEQKRFLGYDWSNRKGDEGIKIQQAGGMLYNEENHNASNTIAAAIRNNFAQKGMPNLGEEKQKYCTLTNLSNMIDFSRTSFDKAINTNATKKLEIQSKYTLTSLSNVALLVRGVNYGKGDQVQNQTNNIVLTADNITLSGKLEIVKKVYIRENINFPIEKQLKQNDCFICLSSGSKEHVGKICFIEQDTNYYAGGFMGILRSKNVVNPKFLYNLLNSKEMRYEIRNSSTGSNIQNLANSILNIKIPLPPIDIQKQIVSECEKVDKEYNTSRMSIEDYKKRISKIFEDLEVITHTGGVKLFKIGELCEVRKGQSITQKQTKEGNIKVVAGGTGFAYYHNEANRDANIITISASGAAGFVNFWKEPIFASDCTTLKAKTDMETYYIYHYLKNMQEEIYKLARGSAQLHVYPDDIKNIQIPIPSIEKQKEIVEQIEKYEKEIENLQAIMNSCKDRKDEILKKYLY